MKVSVIMITYNHEKYIEQAIKSVLMQQTTFDIELIVANDCSPDSTDSIVSSLIKNHEKGHIIINLLHDKNLGAELNFRKAFEIAKGKYIAFCEGDDYWSDSLKLQKQVDFLEGNLDYSLCFHPVARVSPEGKHKSFTNTEHGEEIDFYDLIKANYIHISSALMRKSLLPDQLPTWFADLPMGDWPLNLLAASKGKMRMLPEPMSCYREHPGGVWTSRSMGELHYSWLKAIFVVYKQFDNKYKKHFMKKAAGRAMNLLLFNFYSKNKYHFKEAIYYYFLTTPYRPLRNIFTPLKLAVKMVKRSN